MRYFLYARKSTEDKARQIQSIPDQLRILGDLARARGLEIVETITDVKSAKAPGRKGFSEMMSRIQKGEADGILCWKIDRLSRNAVDGGTLMWALQNGTVKEIVTPERTYFPQDNTLLLSVEFGLATQMIRDLSMNVQRGMRSKIDKGWLPTKAPIGYLNEKTAIKGEKRILPDPILFPIIQDLWRHLLSSHCSLMALYMHMQEHSPIYVRGKLIAFSSFYRIFQNTFYCGVFSWRGQKNIGAHQPMITQSEFEEAQTFITEKRGIRDRTLRFDLKGELRCGTCDALITAEEHRKFVKREGAHKTYRFYRCHHRKRGTACTEKPLSEKKIEDHVFSLIDRITLPDDILAIGIQTFEEMRKSTKESIAEHQYKRHLSEIERRITVIEGNLAEEQNADARVVIMDRLRTIRIERQAVQEDIRKAGYERENQYRTISNVLELIQRAKKTFISGTPDQKKAILRALGSNWRISSQNLTCDQSYIVSALEKTKELHSGDLKRFELIKAKSGSGFVLDRELASNVWSG